jgi:phospholipase/carboxylesterase
MTVSPNPNLAIAPVITGTVLEESRMVGVLVHGRDQDEQVMLDVVDRLDLPDVGYVLPVAAGNAWYPGRHFDPVSANEPHISWAFEALEAALGVAVGAGVPEDRIVLAGFSQGACLTAELIARRPRPLGGVGVLTGCLFGPLGDQVTPIRVAGLAVFVQSSRIDEWIELKYVEATARAFEAAGARVTLETNQDPVHHVSDDAVAGLRQLLSAA